MALFHNSYDCKNDNSKSLMSLSIGKRRGTTVSRDYFLQLSTSVPPKFINCIEQLRQTSRLRI